ncbi:5'/3'-nucleotidase SurE, partial [Soehngenia saccharolytica]
ENGRIRLTVHGNYNENAPEGTDFRALVDGYISVGKVNNLR